MYAHPDDPEIVERVRAIKRNHYYKNKEAYLQRAKDQRQACREVVHKAKDVPCTDCGQRYPYWVMQFDHLGNKLSNINTIVASGSMKALLVEMEKCEVVCANCHAERTYSRLITVCMPLPYEGRES